MRTSTWLALMVAAAGAGAAWGQDKIRLDSPAPGDPEAVYAQPEREPLPIEICFVIDTTGSMTRLLQGAKDKVWSIANDILRDNPKSALRMGIVAYRDRDSVSSSGTAIREEYITKRIDLTDDLDTLYRELIKLQAKGGGDRPESVNQALREAVEVMPWSKGPAVRLIFLVGDSPPHMDYAGEVQYPQTLEGAVRLGIIVNAVQCGAYADTTEAWKDIATRGKGMYFSLGDAVTEAVIATAQDKKLLDLNAQLAQTVVPYGSQAQQASVLEKATSFKAMPTEAAAARAAVNNLTGGRALQGKGDLVQDAQADKDLLARLKPEELPAAMQKMTVPEREAYVADQAAKRQAINAQIAAVTRERDAAVLESTRLAAGTSVPGASAGSYRGGAAGGAGAGGMGGMGGGAGGGRGGGGGMGGGGFSGAVRTGTAAGRAAAGGR